MQENKDASGVSCEEDHEKEFEQVDIIDENIFESNENHRMTKGMTLLKMT